MIKCCMFDLDGTLLDTLSTITHYVNLTLQKYGVSPINEEECKGFVGNGARMLMRRALAARGAEGLPFDAVMSDYIAAYDTDPYYLTEPYSGVSELIKELSARGIACAVVSNKQHSSTCAAIAEFFPDGISAVRGGMDGVPLKPDPTAPLAILAELGISPEQTAFVGDTAVDIMTAKNMGAARAIGVSWGFRSVDELASAGADRIANTAQDVLKAVTE